VRKKSAQFYDFHMTLCKASSRI